MKQFKNNPNNSESIIFQVDFRNPLGTINMDRALEIKIFDM